jgi:hypothetical protein
LVGEFPSRYPANAEICTTPADSDSYTLVIDRGTSSTPATYKAQKKFEGEVLSRSAMSQLNLLPSEIPLQNLYQLLQPITVSPTSPKARFSNWGHTYHATPLAVFEPENDFQCELVLELARRERKVVRAVGVGHSPSDLACTNEFMLRTGKLNRLLEVRI